MAHEKISRATYTSRGAIPPPAPRARLKRKWCQHRRLLSAAVLQARRPLCAPLFPLRKKRKILRHFAGHARVASATGWRRPSSSTAGKAGLCLWVAHSLPRTVVCVNIYVSVSLDDFQLCRIDKSRKMRPELRGKEGLMDCRGKS